MLWKYWGLCGEKIKCFSSLLKNRRDLVDTVPLSFFSLTSARHKSCKVLAVGQIGTLIFRRRHSSEWHIFGFWHTVPAHFITRHSNQPTTAPVSCPNSSRESLKANVPYVKGIEPLQIYVPPTISSVREVVSMYIILLLQFVSRLPAAPDYALLLTCCSLIARRNCNLLWKLHYDMLRAQGKVKKLKWCA